jgi:hypothetical protein
VSIVNLSNRKLWNNKYLKAVLYPKTYNVLFGGSGSGKSQTMIQLFLSEMPSSYFHVFTYSERDNTTALRIAEVVPMETRFERNKILRIMSEKKKRAFYSEFLQKERKVMNGKWQI